jgi:hypothetical protein
MKIEVSELNEAQLHELMRCGGIDCGVLRTVGQATWLVYDARC